MTLDVDAAYDADVLLSESFTTLPGRRPPVDAVSNFLGGYVPEGRHREVMAAKRRVDKDDLFALLREFGGSIAGAVTLRPPDEPATYRPRCEPLDDGAVSARLRQALDASDQAIGDDSRSTLPGDQPKVLVARMDGQWLYPHGRAHSTHLLKPQVPSGPSRLVDEHDSHLLTQRRGLSNDASEICRAQSTTYLAIERFDRTVADGAVRPLHPEDLAQALRLDWRETDTKFQDPDWPDDPRRATLRRIAELLGSVPGGDAAVEQWLRALTFHVAIGNNDAHATNVALLHLSTGTKFAPVYDALPNLFQAGLVKWDLALAVDGIFDHRRVSVEGLLAEARSWGVIGVARATALVTATLVALDEALTGIAAPEGVSPGMIAHLQWTVHRLLAGEAIGEPTQ